MYYKYQGDGQEYIIKTPEVLWIPMDNDNTDYVIFLKYLADNNLTLADIPDWIN